MSRRSAAFSSVSSSSRGFDKVKNFEEWVLKIIKITNHFSFMNETDSDDDSPKKQTKPHTNTAASSMTASKVENTSHNFKGNSISTLKSSNGSHNLPSHLFVGFFWWYIKRNSEFYQICCQRLQRIHFKRVDV